MKTIEIPLFPLRTVLFPEGLLPLRIFERRYLDMVRDCARDDSAFGGCLTHDREDSDAAAGTAQTGTLARITDWYTLEDGLLGVSAIGTERFVTEETWREPSGLLHARVHLLTEPPHTAVPAAFALLSEVLDRFMDKVGDHYPQFTPEHLQDATWVGYRLAELLPLSGIEKQHLLALDDPVARLQVLLETLPRFQRD
ncbi:MAG: LON peptidase substrate-binding domain-containing protein [Xanthomonadales bacterium]